jgi:hypothetical protein
MARATGAEVGKSVSNVSSVSLGAARSAMLKPR